jgi:YegS/Rv2252/BmrU family lipid kinase
MLVKTTVIANPMAKAGGLGRSWPQYQKAIEANFSISNAQMTERPGQTASLVQAARLEGAKTIIIVGGDGTFNEAVNGLADPSTGVFDASELNLVLLPVGTGSDFARSIAMPALSARTKLEHCAYRLIDVGKIELMGPNNETVAHYFINEASIGATALIVHRVNRASKSIGGKAAFALGTVRGLASWKDRRVRIRADDRVDETATISAVALANGRYFGGGMKIAPRALLDDGKLDIVVIKGAGVLKFIQRSRKLYQGDHLGLPEFSFFQGCDITVEQVDGPAPVLVETDGETPGYLPARCTVLPKALNLLAPWAKAEAVATFKTP